MELDTDILQQLKPVHSTAQCKRSCLDSRRDELRNLHVAFTGNLKISKYLIVLYTPNIAIIYTFL